MHTHVHVPMRIRWVVSSHEFMSACKCPRRRQEWMNERINERTHVHMYACSYIGHACIQACKLSCMLAYINLWLLSCNACIYLILCIHTCMRVCMPRTPAHLRNLICALWSGTYFSHKIYGSFCNWAMQRKALRRIRWSRGLRTVCVSAVKSLPL